MDVIADILTSTRVGGAIYCRHGQQNPWGLRFAQARVVGFHYVAQGECWLRMLDGSTKRLETGDFILLPRGTAHDLVSSPQSLVIPFTQAPCVMPPSPDVVLVCGAFLFESQGPHPIFSLLPEQMYLSAARMAEEPGLTALLALLDAELVNSQPAGQTLIGRLLDALFIYALRLWTRTQEHEQGGVLGALRDEAINRALALMHAQPAEEWTVEGLGRAVGLSRAVFAKRFQALVGEAPLQYLTHLRMQAACKWLRQTEEPLEQIAVRVGYADGFSFNRAFRRVIGVPPGQYRSASGA
jgi:AraC-like DNA-binding protein